MSINKDQVEGRVKEAAGKVQETAGKAVGNTKQELKGTINKATGAAQAKYGDVKSDVKDADRKARSIDPEAFTLIQVGVVARDPAARGKRRGDALLMTPAPYTHARFAQ